MFRKYPSLTNHYMEADISRFVRIYEDDLDGLQWHVGEKLHGANISFLFTPNAPVKYFSRNNDITNDMFYGAGEVFEATRLKMECIQNYCNLSGDTVRQYGELFGASVQKGVDYGNVKKIRFYDMMINDVQQTVETFDQHMGLWRIEDLKVPVFGIFESLKEALAFDNEQDSQLVNPDAKVNREMEGVVIKPYNKVLEDINGSLFYIKKKGEKFKEAQSVKKAKKDNQQRALVNEWKAILNSYIHPERLESVFSKEGRIESMKDLGKYIKAVHDDVVETFFKEEPDYPKEVLTKSEEKYILNTSKEIVILLKQELMKG